MPLVVEVKRDGERMQLKWGYQILSCVYTAAMIEASPETVINDEYTYGTIPEFMYVDWSYMPIYYMSGCPLLDEGRQVLKEDHTFRIQFEGDEPELIEFKAGDQFRAWRESK